MDTQITEIADWFMGQLHAPLIIRKEEQGDVDQVFLTLEKVSYIPGNPDRDDYVEEDRLVLQGEGRIVSDPSPAGNSSELPRQSYEIPLQPGFHGKIGEHGLTLRTERASYQVNRQM